MEKLYLNPDGTFPAAEGVPLLVTEAEFRECCCPEDAPCSCPCEGTWPPAEWPCGGLLEEYAVVYAVEDGTTKWRGTGTVTAVSAAGGCLWSWSGTSEVDYGEGAGWEADTSKTGNVRIESFPTPCRWVFQVQAAGSVAPLFEKLTGLTPVGTYTVEAGLTGSATVS
jgi:hypothetical protein